MGVADSYDCELAASPPASPPASRLALARIRTRCGSHCVLTLRRCFVNLFDQCPVIEIEGAVATSLLLDSLLLFHSRHNSNPCLQTGAQWLEEVTQLFPLLLS